MVGIQYLVDEKGRETAAVIDLDIYGDVWEDIHDLLVVESRLNEPRVRWEDTKQKLRQKRIESDGI